MLSSEDETDVNGHIHSFIYSSKSSIHFLQTFCAPQSNPEYEDSFMSMTNDSDSTLYGEFEPHPPPPTSARLGPKQSSTPRAPVSTRPSTDRTLPTTDESRDGGRHEVISLNY